MLINADHTFIPKCLSYTSAACKAKAAAIISCGLLFGSMGSQIPPPNPQRCLVVGTMVMLGGGTADERQQGDTLRWSKLTPG